MNDNQSPEDFLHALIETYDLAPANEPFTIHLDQINRLCNAEAILRSRKLEIEELDRMLNQANEKLEKLEKRFAEQNATHRELLTEWKTTQKALDTLRFSTETHEAIRAKLAETQYALTVAICTVDTDESYFHEKVIERVFVDLRNAIATDGSDLPF